MLNCGTIAPGSTPASLACQPRVCRLVRRQHPVVGGNDHHQYDVGPTVINEPHTINVRVRLHGLTSGSGSSLPGAQISPNAGRYLVSLPSGILTTYIRACTPFYHHQITHRGHMQPKSASDREVGKASTYSCRASGPLYDRTLNPVRPAHRIGVPPPDLARRPDLPPRCKLHQRLAAVLTLARLTSRDGNGCSSTP